MIAQYVFVFLHQLEFMPVTTDHCVLSTWEGDPVFCFGENSYGQLGVGKVHKKTAFSVEVVNIDARVLSIATGNDHTAIVSDDGSLWSWGSNQKGACGLGDQVKSVCVPTQIPDTCGFISVSAGDNFTLALDRNGGSWMFGYSISSPENFFRPWKIPSLPPIRAVAAGSRHLVLLDSNDELWSFGNNSYG
jgi:alpha-tubulin suppressor-like RCC1 family protein